jgi:hypothetical protein
VGNDGYKVVTEALRKEAPEWHDFADQVERIRVDVRDAFLGVTAFFCGTPALLPVPDINGELHQAAYEGFRSYMENLLTGAVAELPQIGQAMIEMAEEYEAHEEIVELDLNKIYDATQWH